MARSAYSLIIARSDDLQAALALAREAHLEVSASPQPPLAMWGAFDGDRMVGTVSLDDCQGLPVVGRIAVSRFYRGRGLGKRLLTALEEEARRRTLTELWATARAPGFFISMGFSAVGDGRERDLLLSECRACPQYGTDCRPQAMRRTVQGSTARPCYRPYPAR
jgi:GNAT superfamily N-acetyltransferase